MVLPYIVVQKSNTKNRKSIPNKAINPGFTFQVLFYFMAVSLKYAYYMWYANLNEHKCLPSIWILNVILVKHIKN